MSNPSLNWEFHDDKDDEVQGGRPEKPRRRVPWGKIVLGLLLGVIILAVAGVGGFAVGRFQRATTAARTDLQAALDIETWAWQSGNRQLFASSIDLAAPAPWRRDLEKQFEMLGKDLKSVTLSDLRFVDTDLVQVNVDLLTSHGLQHETRYYRLINGQWRRTAKNGG